MDPPHTAQPSTQTVGLANTISPGDDLMDRQNSGSARIRVRNLWKVFGPKPNFVLQQSGTKEASKKELQERTGHVIAIKNVSFDVREGEVFVVMGLSGSGKSTLIRSLIRLVDPTAGSIEIDGEDIVKYDSHQLTQLRRSKIGMVFQHYGLLPHRNVLDNTAFGLEVQGASKNVRYAKAREMLETVGLSGWEKSYPNELSGGMQQRVGIARALSLDPEILLMDEPFSGLDPLIRREMQDELISLQAQVKKTIVFVTHDLNEALKLGNYIAIMRDGEIIQMGTAEEIVTKPADAYVREFVRDISKARVIGAASIMQEPSNFLFASQGLREAMDSMQSDNLTYSFVIDKDRQLVGYLTLDQILEAQKRGAATVDNVAKGDYPSATPETLVEELVALAAEFECPIAVVSKEGELLGEIHRETLLNSLADSPPTQNGY